MLPSMAACWQADYPIEPVLHPVWRGARDSSLLKRSSSHAEDCGGEFYAAPKFSRNSSP